MQARTRALLARGSRQHFASEAFASLSTTHTIADETAKGGVAPSRNLMLRAATLLAPASLSSSPSNSLLGAPYTFSSRTASACSTGRSLTLYKATGCHQDAGSSHVIHSASSLQDQCQLSSSVVPSAAEHTAACRCRNCRLVRDNASSSSSQGLGVAKSLGYSSWSMQGSSTHAMHSVHSINSVMLSRPTSHSASYPCIHCSSRRSLWSAAFSQQSAAAGWRRQCTRSQPQSLHSARSTGQQPCCPACGRKGPCMHQVSFSTAAGSHAAGPDAAPADDEQAPKQTPKDLLMMFTCNKCDTRAVKAMTRNAYEKGVVLVRCPGCNGMHLIADNLGWFGDPANVEDFLREKGEAYVRANADTMEISAEDVIGWSKAKSKSNGDPVVC